jgi:hypothetical protein
MDQRQEAGELRPVLPLTVQSDRALEMTDPGADAALGGVGEADQEMRFGLVRELARHHHGMVASGFGGAAFQRCARGKETGWFHQAVTRLGVDRPRLSPIRRQASILMTRRRDIPWEDR